MYTVYVLLIESNGMDVACSVATLSSVNSVNEFGQIRNTMRLLQACHKRNKILHWENLYIQKYHTEGKLIKEQIPEEQNILFTPGRVATLQATFVPFDSISNT